MAWHVTRTANNKWAVSKSGAARASKFFFEKEDAKAYARKRAAEEGSSIYLHRPDGTIQEQQDPAGQSPVEQRAEQPGQDNEDTALYVQPDTLDRLMAQERIIVSDADQETVMTFTGHDPIQPGRTVRTSTEITHNAVHIRRWLGDEGRYIFEYVGDI